MEILPAINLMLTGLGFMIISTGFGVIVLFYKAIAPQAFTELMYDSRYYGLLLIVSGFLAIYLLSGLAPWQVWGWAVLGYGIATLAQFIMERDRYVS